MSREHQVHHDGRTHAAHYFVLYVVLLLLSSTEHSDIFTYHLHIIFFSVYLTVTTPLFSCAVALAAHMSEYTVS